MAKPFIKWAGGKTYLLPTIINILSNTDCSKLNYCEPMVGGGAVLFALGNNFKSRLISDINKDLINLYKIIQSNVDQLIEELNNGEYFYKHKSDLDTLNNYKRIRASAPTTPIKNAARIIYLMKTCFNGLYRQNFNCQFNTPPGSYTNPVICNENTLYKASDALQNTIIYDSCCVIKLITQISNTNTLLFVDPPYHHPKPGKFTNYSEKFDEQKQKLLIDTILKSKCSFIYTNRATDFILNQFKDTNITLLTLPLCHSIQPRYTTNMIESELVAYNINKVN